ncbi:hypothetical protein J3B02_001586 [Coemansia erecta]|nr:hypothetical protein J3B02_001586 [Coemansia erecta]KAJ2884685.1 hypothetical protein FB639_001917 [Coemansia asiatica]
MTPASSTASTPEEQPYNTFLYEQMSQESLSTLLSYHHHHHHHHRNLHFLSVSSSTPFITHSPLLMSSANQGWTPVLTDTTNTPVVQNNAAAAIAAHGNFHGISGISPELLVADMGGTSHYATHFPPLSSVSAAQPTSLVSDYTTAAGNSGLFLPATISTANVPMGVGLGIFGDISVPASHRNIAEATLAMSSYPQIPGVQDMDVRSYPFSPTMNKHRPNGSLGFDMETAAKLSDVLAVIEDSECSAAKETALEHLSPASIDAPKNSNAQKTAGADALGCKLQHDSHMNENKGNQASTISSTSSSSFVLPDDGDSSSASSFEGIPDDCVKLQRQTMSKRQQMSFCRYLLDHPGRPFPKEADRFKLTVDKGVTKKRFYWWFSNQRHRSFKCSVVNGKRQYTPKIQFYRMCVRLGVLAPECVPTEFRSLLKKRKK